MIKAVNKKNVLAVFLACSLSVHLYAQNQNPDVAAKDFVENSKESVIDLKRRLEEQVRNLKKLQTDVKDVEYTLVLNTKKYQKLVEDRTKI